MPGIDALRGIAVLAVFLYHANVGWLPGGFLGVDVFFVISGYLITSLLLSEYRKRGHIDVVQFWLRRARRLLPAVGVMIAVTMVVAAIFVPEDIGGLRGDAIASLFYVNNWHLILSDQSYFEQFQRPSLFRHLWTLSVEEQFYLLWPLAFAAGMTLLGRRRMILGVVAGAILSTLLMALLYHAGHDPVRAFYGTDTRAAPLLVGVFLAFVWNPSTLGNTAGRWAPVLLDAVGAFALLMVILNFTGVHDFDSGLYNNGGFLLLAFWTGLLVGVLAHPAARLGRLLATPPLLWVGLRSYSIYLWHWPVVTLTRAHQDVPLGGPILTILQFAVVAVIADLSFRYVEEPFRLRTKMPSAPSWLRVGRPALAVVVAATVLIIGYSGIVSTGGSDLRTEVAHAKTPDRPNRETTSTSVLAIGDSVMVGAAPELEQRLGDNLVLNAAISRQADDVIALLEGYRASGQLPDTVVLQLGNNGPLLSDQMDELHDAMRGVEHIFLINDEAPVSWEGESNGALQDAADEWENTTLLDWHDIANSDSSLTSDGIHLTPSGIEAYSNLIVDALASDLGSDVLASPEAPAEAAGPQESTR
jgi:peptidoglycan/LPS O-acetylase OafA/YrhL/lysophospholipase L1-like esterase